MPPPDPRSRTISPGRSSASAVGLPQPKDALNASSGIPSTSAGSYRSEVIGSTQPSELGADPQHELLPVLARSAASLYFCLTVSLNSMLLPFAARLYDSLRLNGMVASAALGVKKSEQFFKSSGICFVTQKSAFTPDRDQVLVFELLYDSSRLNGMVAGAALGVKKSEQFLR